MIIPIDDKWRISADEKQWSVQKYAGIDKETGNPKWNPVTYHPTLQGAVTSLAERLIRASDAQTVADAIAEVKVVSETLTRALTPVAKVQIRTA